MKIPYQLVSMAAIIRDFDDPEYLNDEHYKLTSIADYLYNSADGAFSDHPEDNLLPEFKVVFDNYGADYFKQVTDDMYAIDGQITSAAKEDELLADYMDRLHNGVTASTRVSATDDGSYAHNLVRISGKDAKYTLANLNKSKKTLGLYGVPGDKGYYLSEFEEATPGFMWACDTGLGILDDNGISYELVKPAVECSRKFKTTKQHKKIRSYTYIPSGSFPKKFSPDTFDVYNALLPYIGEYSSNTGWTGSCKLQKVPDKTSVDGYSYKVIWDGNEVDMFSWLVNDNPRIKSEYTLMVMPAHGMPDFCDSEHDFYQAVRKIFGGGLKKIGN